VLRESLIFACCECSAHHSLECEVKSVLCVQILDRKNSEIEDVKSHYRSKTKELEETITKLERKGTAVYPGHAWLL